MCYNMKTLFYIDYDLFRRITITSSIVNWCRICRIYISLTSIIIKSHIILINTMDTIKNAIDVLVRFRSNTTHHGSWRHYLTLSVRELTIVVRFLQRCAFCKDEIGGGILITQWLKHGIVPHLITKREFISDINVKYFTKNIFLEIVI